MHYFEDEHRRKLFDQKNKKLMKIYLKNLFQSKLSKIFAILVLLSSSLYLLEIFPRFIVPSMSLPSDDYPSQIWIIPSYTVINLGQTRYFSWRTSAILSFENIPENKSRQLIYDDFDQQLSEQGWIKSNYDPESYTNCYDGRFFPQASFLDPRQDFLDDGYIVYKRKSNVSFLNSKASDEICLALWRHWENAEGIYDIELFTIKPSPLTWINYVTLQ